LPERRSAPELRKLSELSPKRLSKYFPKLVPDVAKIRSEDQVDRFVVRFAGDNSWAIWEDV